jgi:hypothetical protein
MNEYIREMIDGVLKNGEDNPNYNKFPLSALITQAKKFENFQEFSKFYAIDIYHGYYWHLTTNPNFNISDTTGPEDKSSLSYGGISEYGAIMITSDLDYWDEYYNTSKDSDKRDVKRKYVVLFDASNIDPKSLKQVSRGFGNEIYLNAPTAKKLKKIGVYSLKYAKSLDNKFDKMIPQSENNLYELWKFANSKK